MDNLATWRRNGDMLKKYAEEHRHLSRWLWIFGVIMTIAMLLTGIGAFMYVLFALRDAPEQGAVALDQDVLIALVIAAPLMMIGILLRMNMDLMRMASVILTRLDKLEATHSKMRGTPATADSTATDGTAADASPNAAHFLATGKDQQHRSEPATPRPGDGRKGGDMLERMAGTHPLHRWQKVCRDVMIYVIGMGGLIAVFYVLLKVKGTPDGTPEPLDCDKLMLLVCGMFFTIGAMFIRQQSNTAALAHAILKQQQPETQQSHEETPEA